VSTFSLFRRFTGIYYLLIKQEGKRRWKSTGARSESDALMNLSQVRANPQAHAPAIPWIADGSAFLKSATSKSHHQSLRLTNTPLHRQEAIAILEHNNTGTDRERTKLNRRPISERPQKNQSTIKPIEEPA
jgi:hypothetical protein